jgi:glycosyltransferase involved in cell wall biosynthesis
MRVLLCHQPTDGGVGRHVADLIDGLTAADHEVVVCSPAVPAATQSAVRHLPLEMRRAISPRADLIALARFARIVREVRPELIHAHSSKAGAVARLARAAHPRIPVLYTPHGYAFAGYFQRSSERLAYKTVERALAPATSIVTCVCEAEARLARTVAPSRRVRVVRNGIAAPPAGAADPRVADLRDRGPVLGALTLLRPGKGLETLLDATPLVRERHPQAQLAIVGEGPDLEQLSEQARTLGIADGVHFLGQSSDPLSSMRGMDLLVHPSWAEAFPYVILEAMALGLPIVASDVGGIGEALVDGESGLLAPPRDAPALARALSGLLSDPERAARLGRGALARSALFTREAMVERLSAVYAELLPPTPARGALLEAPERRSLRGHG